MRQQINLYNKIERPQIDPLNAQLMLLSCVGFLVLMLLVSVFVNYGNSNKEREVASTSASLQSLQQQVDQLKSTRDKLSDPAPIQAKIDRVKVQLKMKQLVLVELKNMPESQQHGFSSYMAGLVNQHLDGLWFTGLEISDGGEHIALTGKTKKPELVPRYLRLLSEEKAYVGQQFNIFRISQPEKQRWVHNFEVRSEEKIAQDLVQGDLR